MTIKRPILTLTLLCLLLIVVGWLNPIVAQTAPLTNQDVISMQKSELGAEIILAKIKNSRANFDTSPTALQDLKKEGVPDSVVLAMIEAMTPKPTAPALPVEKRPVDPSLPVYGSFNELRDKHKVYVTADEINSRDFVRLVFKKYEGLQIVNDPSDADFILLCETRSSTESRGRQSSHYLRTQLTAYTVADTGQHRILWQEDETYEEANGFSFSRPNEVNLAMHFIAALKDLRGEKKKK